MSAPSSNRPAGKRVQMLATCLCDAFFDDAARATVEVLEHLGCTMEFPEAQTCCGQPAFNAGDWPASRRVVRHTVKVFSGDDARHRPQRLVRGHAHPRRAAGI